MAHPSLGIARLDAPEIVARSVLLEFEGDRLPLVEAGRPGWRWGAGPASKPKGVIRFNLFDQMIHAAMVGQALGASQFIHPMLSDGRLLRLATPQPGPRSNNHCSACSSEPAPPAETRALIDWIVAEAQLTDGAGRVTPRSRRTIARGLDVRERQPNVECRRISSDRPRPASPASPPPPCTHEHKNQNPGG